MRYFGAVMLHSLCLLALAGCGSDSSPSQETASSLLPVSIAPAPTPSSAPTTPVNALPRLTKVSTLAELTAELQKAKPGDVITLASGKYGALSLTNISFSAPVTIIGEGDRTASFETITLSKVQNLRLVNLVIGRPLASGEATWVRFANVSSSSSVSFDNIHFRGSLDSNPHNDGRGLLVRDCMDISVTNSTFEQLNLGIEVGTTQKIRISENAFHDLRTDAIAMNGVTDVLIKRNSFRDFYPMMGDPSTEDHPDAIQFFTAGANMSSQNIEITSNIILQGYGGSIQGIFLTDQNGNLPYKNVVISNNLVYIRAWTGIMIGNGDNVVVTNNSTLSPIDDNMHLRIHVKDVRHVLMENNVVDEFVIEATPPQQAINIELRYDPAARSAIHNLNADQRATIADLVHPSLGYRPDK